MATRWIDFTELKRAVHGRGGIREVLRRYGFLEHLTESGTGKLVGPCPIHGSSDRTSKAFHVDCHRDLWHCFSQCKTDRGKAGGGVLELVMLIDNCTLRQAGEKLSGWFNLTFERETGNARWAETAVAVATHTSRSDPGMNPPLERPLKNLNNDHPYLFERGLTAPTIGHFGVGHCTRGLMRGRIAIPIHDHQGVLIAYAGRAISEEMARETGKYRLPANFAKSHVVWNLNRAKEHAGKGLIVVEGFFDAMKVHQAGFRNVVALMGCSLSAEQEELLVGYADRLAVMVDGDEAGKACKKDIWRRLIRQLYIRDIRLENDEQPDSLTADRIRALLS